jgi:hypothetical protein
MDPVRAILRTLAGLTREAELGWHAGRAAVRARGQTPVHNEAFSHFAKAQQCLIAAVKAADLPAGFRMYDVTLSRDPVTAARQLCDAAHGHDDAGPIEAAHEAARLAYRTAYAEPLTDTEQRYAALLADLPAARRDKVVDLAEERARTA